MWRGKVNSTRPTILKQSGSHVSEQYHCFGHLSNRTCRRTAVWDSFLALHNQMKSSAEPSAHCFDFGQVLNSAIRSQMHRILWSKITIHRSIFLDLCWAPLYCIIKKLTVSTLEEAYSRGNTMQKRERNLRQSCIFDPEGTAHVQEICNNIIVISSFPLKMLQANYTVISKTR